MAAKTNASRSISDSLAFVKNSDERYRQRLDYIQRRKRASKVERAGIEILKGLRHWSYIRRSPLNSAKVPTSPVLIVTVAFNNPDLIRLQAEALSAFLVDDYLHVVIDNSPDLPHRAKVLQVAKDCGLSYFGAPENPFSWIDPSVSHAFALDWAWRQVVSKVEPELVVFLDHDVFPTQKTSVRALLGGHLVAGYKRESEHRWLVWPGLFIANYSDLSRFRVSFMPKADTDAGGSLWWSVYSRVAPDRIRFFDRTAVAFGDTSQRFGDGSPGEFHRFEDGWVHLVDGSGWSDGVGKLDRLPAQGTLDELLTFLQRESGRGKI